MTSNEHRKKAPKDLHVGVITVSDTRAAAWEEERDEDESGKIIQRELEKAGYSSNRTIIPDEEDQIEEKLEELISDSEIDAIITTGGTGIASRDKTVEVVRTFLDKELPGVGEALRRLGYERVGGPALLTRATAGVANQKPLFCFPGAPNSVEVGMDLILPDLAHVVKHARE
ncbi:hypothetical protein AKJ55_01865 [candidate division MSBL1 archaeon SCGC-AAA382M17]|uniref:MoaB/Mog domain-containing protein n=1 Tax=candidate division MSBL1 archaeon SCGC-AAA382M17 TaxID=1698284 RepID=A0ABR5TJU1_9EURY|nr:hypothetical protein AKJ55_01865 [candidate division MSBL1 archaeon SCGC-AAA382M17]